MSFQRSIVPLLRLVTAPEFLNCALDSLRNRVLACVADSLDLCRVADCLQQLVARGGIADAAFRSSEVSNCWRCIGRLPQPSTTYI